MTLFLLFWPPRLAAIVLTCFLHDDDGQRRLRAVGIVRERLFYGEINTCGPLQAPPPIDHTTNL